jgi:hypothetical protein
MSTRGEALFKTALQVVAILGLVLIMAVILHKGYADIARLAREHAGGDFWAALARYVFKNLAGG